MFVCSEQNTGGECKRLALGHADILFVCVSVCLLVCGDVISVACDWLCMCVYA